MENISKSNKSDTIRVHAIHTGLRITYYIHHNESTMRTIDFDEAVAYVQKHSDAGDFFIEGIFDGLDQGQINSVTFAGASE